MSKNIVKFLLIFILPLYFIVGCSPALNADPDIVQFSGQNYVINQAILAMKGEVMVWTEAGYKNNRTGQIISGVKKEIVFGGMQGDIILLRVHEYRTNSNGVYIREPFSQDVTYNVSNSNFIQLNNYVFRIVKASPDGIVFKVARDS